MSKKIVALVIVAVVVLAGTGSGLGTYFFMKNNNKNAESKEPQASVAGQENHSTEKYQDEEILNEIEKMQADLNAQINSLDEKVTNMEESQKEPEAGSVSGDTVVSTSSDDIGTSDYDEADVITMSEEEEYLNELESELEDYYSLYEDTEDLINETEALLEDLDIALDEAKQIYDEMDQEAREAIDAATQYAYEFEQNLSQFTQVSADFKTQYESLETITDLRSELLQIQKNGTNPEKLAGLKEYFSQLASAMDVMAAMDLNQFSVDFISGYFAKIPDYLNVKPLAGVFDSLSGFQVPSVELPGLPDIELPGLGK